MASAPATLRPLSESQSPIATESHSLGRYRSSDAETETATTRVLPTSTEYDMMRENYFINDGEDRSTWYSRMLEEHPEIRNFIERVDPITRAVTFARLYLPPNRLVDQTTLISLIYQHLRTLGLIESQSSLHSEWDELSRIPSHITWSQLSLLIQRGITRAERFWELSMPSPGQVENVKQTLDEEISRTIGGTPYIAEDATPLSSEAIRDPKYFVIDPEDGEPFKLSLNQLIWLLTTDNQYASALVPAVCLTYKSFTTSKIFFTKLRERFRIAFEEPPEQSTRSIALTFKLFRSWLKDALESIEQPVLEAARLFVETELRPRAPNFCSNLFTEGTVEKAAMDYSSAPEVQLGNCHQIWTGRFSLFDLPPLEIARQMTVWSSLRYYAIQRSELLDNAWTIPRIKHRAPNVCAIYDHYNSIFKWVQTIILTEPNLKARITKMGIIVDVMTELEKMNNYLDMMAIAGGFESPPIYALTGHIQLLTPEQQNEIKRAIELGNPNDNFANIRPVMMQKVEQRVPILPFIPVFLGDIFKYSDNAKSIVDGLINIKKSKRMLSLIQVVEKFKRVKYCFLPIEQVQQKLSNLEELDENSLTIASQEILKAGNTPEVLRSQM